MLSPISVRMLPGEAQRLPLLTKGGALHYSIHYAKTPLRFRKGVLSVNQEGYQ